MKSHTRHVLLIGLTGFALTALHFRRGRAFGNPWSLPARGELPPNGHPLSTGGWRPDALPEEAPAAP